VKRRIRVEQEAEQDLTSAVAYYRREGGEEVALRFVAHAHDALQLLAREPGIGRIFTSAKSERLKSLRAWPLDEFPYVVFYEADEQELRVYSLVHGKRDIERLRKTRFGD
jgi:toxin ParE1/3/4